ncbi:hypothetical protein BpHYR1_047151, partial [Brachionus plicatilis]
HSSCSNKNPKFEINSISTKPKAQFVWRIRFAIRLIHCSIKKKIKLSKLTRDKKSSKKAISNSILKIVLTSRL